MYSSIQTSAKRTEFFRKTLTPVLHLYGDRFLKIWPTCEQGTISRVPPHIHVYGPFGRSGVETRWCLLKPGSYTIHCDDSYGDGWHGGFIEILGNNYCTGFSNGYHDQGGPIEITWDSGPGYHGMYCNALCELIY